MKKYLLLPMAMLILSIGCSKEENTTTETGFGTVEFAPTISLMIETRATTNLPETVIPDAGDFWLLLKGKPGTETESFSAEYEKFHTYDKPYMASGDYTATIRYGDPSQEGVTAYCYEGTQEFTVLARQTIQQNITASLVNSVISLSCSEMFNKYYTDAEFIVRTESGNEFKFANASSAMIFVKAESKLFLSGTATKSQNGVEVQFPEHEIGSTVARTWHKIEVDASQVGQGSIDIRLDDTLTPIELEEIEINPEA
ncbi:MAG TPA: DUF4493 domain-containing protein [Candidatus Alistipes avicola]|uniref:DUF4493 domain-containing protein n=1 Tax=Candidatus Alistipes avicola TaxID=2838432 RepID=A0A9D2L2C9_9BACT|nr:DUF4493 domain-containing protein [uncultured Alistipes sp.]HJA98481.1 DUF4493 domain-containing protein [Candidatus Alistipes avicola]